MATNNLLLCKTFSLSSDYNALSAATDLFTFGKFGDTNSTVNQSIAGTTAEAPIGIAQQTAKKGEGVEVGMIGISKLKLAGTVARGNFIRAITNGEGRLHLGLGIPAAQALESGVANDYITVQILHGFASGA